MLNPKHESVTLQLSVGRVLMPNLPKATKTALELAQEVYV